MEVKQIYSIVNDITKETLGESAVVNEDLSNIVDIGTSIVNANAVDNYVKSLVDRIGKVVFVNRPYSGNVPSVLMDGWEYGSVLQKISMSELPEATENESWELTDKTSYDPNIFYQPKVESQFFNQRVTFEIPMSFTERQVRESFASPEELNGFMSMIYNAIDKSMSAKVDGLIMRTINNMVGETLHADYTDGTYTNASGVKAVNLLYKYNQKFGTTLTAEQAITTPEFIRYASFEIGLYVTRLSKLSSLFNIGGKDRFTPRDMMHIVLLSDFSASAGAYLQSDTYHNEFTALPDAEIVPYWQGSGTAYNFADTSAINIKTASGNTVSATGIIGVLFDRDALGVTNLNRRVTTQYNPKAEFYNNFYKMDCGSFNSTNENFVVFFMA